MANCLRSKLIDLETTAQQATACRSSSLGGAWLHFCSPCCRRCACSDQKGPVGNYMGAALLNAKIVYVLCCSPSKKQLSSHDYPWFNSPVSSNNVKHSAPSTIDFCIPDPQSHGPDNYRHLPLHLVRVFFAQPQSDPGLIVGDEEIRRQKLEALTSGRERSTKGFREGLVLLGVQWCRTGGREVDNSEESPSWHALSRFSFLNFTIKSSWLHVWTYNASTCYISDFFMKDNAVNLGEGCEVYGVRLPLLSCPIFWHLLLQLSYPCRQVQLCNPILSYPIPIKVGSFELKHGVEGTQTDGPPNMRIDTGTGGNEKPHTHMHGEDRNASRQVPHCSIYGSLGARSRPEGMTSLLERPHGGAGCNCSMPSTNTGQASGLGIMMVINQTKLLNIIVCLSVF
eukprot:1157699-Pelagomonas_calceolata.AAC.3